MNPQMQYDLRFYERDISRLVEVNSQGLTYCERAGREREITEMFIEEIEEAWKKRKAIHGFVAIFVNREVRMRIEEKYRPSNGKP